MTEDFRGPSLMRDDELTTTLREIYAAPVESAYWSGLEARIMSRVPAPARPLEPEGVNA